MIQLIDESTLSKLPDWAISAVRQVDERIVEFAAEKGIDLPSRGTSVGKLLGILKSIGATNKSSGSTSIYGATVFLSIAALSMAHQKIFDKLDKTKHVSGFGAYDFFFGTLCSSVSCLSDPETTFKQLAQLGAAARHLETYALRAEVEAYWRQHIPPSLSNEKAATQLSRETLNKPSRLSSTASN
jgi:hypothetical protein